MGRTVKGYPGLYREDCGKDGMRYRIVISHKGQIIQEYFYFRDKKSEKDAKDRAMVRWTKIREKIPVLTKRRFREIERKPSSSGIVGVARIIHSAGGHEYEFWRSTWTDIKGKRKTRMFSVNKYGEKKAKKLAVDTRKEALDALGD